MLKKRKTQKHQQQNEWQVSRRKQLLNSNFEGECSKQEHPTKQKQLAKSLEDLAFQNDNDWSIGTYKILEKFI